MNSFIPPGGFVSLTDLFMGAYSMNEEGKKFDEDKVRMDLIPVSMLTGVGKVLTFGAKKYGDRNWEAGIKWSRVYAAALRHLMAWWGGEEYDQESGLPHLYHATCCLAFLIEYSGTKTEFDDRPLGGI